MAFFYSPRLARFERAQVLGCRDEIRVVIRSMQAQESRINPLVEVEVQVEIEAKVAGHLLVFQEHVIGHDWLERSKGKAVIEWLRRATVWLRA